MIKRVIEEEGKREEENRAFWSCVRWFSPKNTHTREEQTVLLKTFLP
jgi:hypothetical protein